MTENWEKELAKHDASRKLTRLELVQRSFDCCIQTVKSYGSPLLEEQHRKGLIKCMEHFKKLYEKDCEK